MRSLRFQLLLSHLILVLLMGVVMSFAIATFFRLGDSIDRVLTGGFKGALAAQNMQHSLEEQTVAMNHMLVGQLPDARQEFNASWSDLNFAYKAAASEQSPEQQTYIERMGKLLGSYRTAAQDALYAHPPKSRAEAEDRFAFVLRPLLEQMDETTHALTQLNEGQIIRANQRVKNEARTAAFVGVGVTVVVLVVAVGLAFVVVHNALGPLASLAEQAEAIGSGDLTKRINLRRMDEIGALAASFNAMAENLTELHRQEERRLHRAEMMADEALEFLYDPVLVTDAKARIVFLNRAAQGLFGPTLTERTPIGDHVPDRRVVRAVEHAVKESEVSASEDDRALIQIKVAGAERTYRLRASPIKDSEGATLGCVAVLEDISYLRELDRLKNEFIGVASHELRTPVTSLILSVHLMEEGAAGPLSDQQKEIVAAQKEDLERLERLMRELLEISRLEAGVSPPRFEPVSPAELIRLALAGVEHKAESKGVRLVQVEAPDLPLVRADKSQITRVLTNLIDNAIRHTPAGGEVKLRALASKNHVTFRVEDTGEGIPSEYLGRVFERFVQVPGATQGGAGLGLSIVQTIVKAHGGEIKVESKLGKGSAFSFSLGEDPIVTGETPT